MKKIMTLFMAIMMVLIPVNVFAAGGGNGGGNGSGNGSGNGDGKEEGLFIESASIEDGEILGSDESITLVFSKNVVNAEVAEANMALFQVQDSKGTEVEIEVGMADDQVEPDKKNDVVIEFPQGLSDGDYTLTAKSGITSKSGVVMEKDYTLSFKVGNEQKAETTEEAVETQQKTEENKETTQESKSSSGMMIIAIVILAAIVVGVVIWRKKK